jgi:hypothetical protein
MSAPLPVIVDGVGELGVFDADTGEVTSIRDASDRSLAHAAKQIAEYDYFILSCKRALAHELRSRHGVGKATAGGYGFTVAESQSWPVGATQDALRALVAAGVITQGDAHRAMPVKPKPDARQLKALIGRLTVSDPEAARVLAGACSVSPPSVRDVHVVAVDEDVAA